MTLYNSQDTFPCYDPRASTLCWYLPQVTAKSDPCIDYQVLWSHATWNHQNSSVKTVEDLVLLSVNIIILVFQSVFWSIWSHILRNFWWSKYLYGAVTTELDQRAADGIGGVAISDLDYSPMADYLLWVIRRRRGAKIITHSSRATAHSIQRPSYGVELSISQEFAITLWQRGLAGFQVWKNFTSSKEHYHQPRPMMTWHKCLEDQCTILKILQCNQIHQYVPGQPSNPPPMTQHLEDVRGNQSACGSEVSRRATGSCCEASQSSQLGSIPAVQKLSTQEMENQFECRVSPIPSTHQKSGKHFRNQKLTIFAFEGITQKGSIQDLTTV